MDLNNKLDEIERKIKNINANLEQIEKRRKEREDTLDIGIISVAKDRLKIELLLNADDFSEEHLERLKNIANDLQNLLLEIYNK